MMFPKQNRRMVMVMVIGSLVMAGAVIAAAGAGPSPDEPLRPGDCKAYIEPVYFGRGTSEVSDVECEPPHEDRP